MYRKTRDCPCDSVMCLSGSDSAPVRQLIFTGMLPLKRGTEGEQMGMATTWLCPARRGAMLQDGVRDLTRRQRGKDRPD